MDTPLGVVLHRLAQAAPGRPAITCDGITRSRAELDTRTNRLARAYASLGVTRDSLVTALESIKGLETGIVPPVTIGPDHETQKQGFWVKVENGKFKQLTDWLRSE